MKKLGIGIDFGTTNSLASVWGSDVKRLHACSRFTSLPQTEASELVVPKSIPIPSFFIGLPPPRLLIGVSPFHQRERESHHD